MPDLLQFPGGLCCASHPKFEKPISMLPPKSDINSLEIKLMLGCPTAPGEAVPC